MSEQTLSSNSKTEFVIAIDDEDSDSDNDPIGGSHNGIDDVIKQTLNTLLDSIGTIAPIDKMSVESDLVQLDDNDYSDGEIVDNSGQSSVRLDGSTNERFVRPVDDVQDIENMEVNIYSRYDCSDDDMEAEDCMVIENITDDIHFDRQNTGANSESNDSSIEIIDEEDNTHQIEDVIDLSDDDEDCVIINDSFSIKLTKIVDTDGESRNGSAPSKRSLSPVYSSDSFIPLSQPSTSSGVISLKPLPSFRGLVNTGRRPDRDTGRRPDRDTGRRPDRRPENLLNNSKSCSPPSLVDLFRTPVPSSVSTPFQSTYYERNRETTRVISSFIEQNKTTEDERFLYDDPIPFLYEEVRPSTSCPSVGSSNVGDIDLICETVKLDRNVVQNVVNLIEDQCTVPFIVRYRQSAISGIDAERVRKINSVYNELKNARDRAKDVEQMLKKQDRINPRLKAALSRCKTVFEVEHLFSLCRNQSEDSEKYRNLGLSDSAISVLEGKRLDPNHFINRFAFGLDDPEKVTEGWSAIIADIISKDCDVLEFLIAATKRHIPNLHIVINNQLDGEHQPSVGQHTDHNSKNDLMAKYARFKNFVKPVDKINAHTYMAIERGEAIAILNVFIEFETIILNTLIDYCVQKWNRCISHLLVNCVRMAFNNQLKPTLEDYIRFELRHSSHMKALDVFRNNVKHLLLEPPLRGEFVIGIDPGHGSGYKVIVVSPWLVPLDGCVLKLDHHNYESSAIKLRQLMVENRCSIIALGNGTGCRRFEDMLQMKIKSGFFGQINVKYKIINESGVSYYSVTEEAKKDLPNFAPHMIGAITIARRLIDPLSELVKVDPKRLQVGMYMRDIDQKEVKKTFHEVAVECVSFCGVDVNVASFEVLSKVAGLEPTIARMIIEKRERDGLFNSRSQLKNIDGIGWKQFEQCAGFIKVMPLTRRESITPLKNVDKDNEFPNKRSATSTDDYDPLDSTIVHPESYTCANTYLELIGASKEEIGKQSIRTKIAMGYTKYGLPEIGQLCNTHTYNMKLIIEAMSNSIDFDYRTNFAQIYIPDIQQYSELTVGMQLKGRVVNVTPMGAFIDCGIVGGINAYLKAKECDRHSVAVNDNVLVTIESKNPIQHRFSVNIDKVFKTNIKMV